jgi:hypothetical protein
MSVELNILTRNLRTQLAGSGSNDQQIGPQDVKESDQQPDNIDNLKKKIITIADNYFVLFMQKDKMVESLRSHNQLKHHLDEIYSKAAAGKSSFWGDFYLDAQYFWEARRDSFKYLEIKRQELTKNLEDEASNSEELNNFRSMLKTVLLFENFWTEQEGQIYRSLKAYHTDSCTIL